MLYKHVGKVVNTDTRCIVVCMQIPGRTDHSLIVATDSLPDHFEHEIRKVLESAEGQASVDFADVLQRRLLSNTGVRMIEALHNARLLQPVHIDNLVMVPHPSQAIPMRNVLIEMGRSLPQKLDAPVEKYNPHGATAAQRSSEERVGIAKTLLSEAADLKLEAERKMKQAYDYAPELVGVNDAAPVNSPSKDSSVAVTSEARLSQPVSSVVNDPHDAPKASMSDIERLASMMDGSYTPPAPSDALGKDETSTDDTSTSDTDMAKKRSRSKKA